MEKNDAGDTKKPRAEYRQVEKSTRAFDGAELVWHRTMGDVWWEPWVLVRVNGKGPII